MRQVMVRYKVKPDRVAENEELVRAVYDELRCTAPAGLRYATFRLDDGVSFVHLSVTDTEDGHNPLSDVNAFKEFQANIAERCEEAPVVTSFVFRVRNVPAALYKAMGGFATNGVNMTKLESYQLEGQFSATQFYADVEGHPSERNVRLALEELEFFTSHLRVLGVYKASPYRAEIARRMAVFSK